MRTHDLSTEKLVTDLKRVLHDSEELLAASKDVAGEKASELKERLWDALEGAKRNYRKIEGKVVNGAKATDRTIREHPYQSIGVAFGVGMLIGFLVTRRKQ